MGSLKRIRQKIQRDGVFGMAKHALSSTRRHAFQDMMRLETARERFTRIYDEGIWRGGESKSGEGSDRAYTKEVRSKLPTLIRKYKIDRIVDAGCGDFNWMRLVMPEISASYTGLDIVESVITQNNRRFKSDRIKFAVADVCEDRIPACDLILARDCMFHLSNEDADRFLRNLAATEYNYLLTTTHIVEEGFRNSDIRTADFRRLDLFRTPFHFRPDAVLECIRDYPDGSQIPRSMVLFEKSAVPGKLDYRNAPPGANVAEASAGPL